MKIDDTLNPFRVFNPITDILALDFDKTTVHERALLRKEYIDSLKKTPEDFIIAWDYLEYIPGKNTKSVDSRYGNPWYNKNVIISTCGKIARIKGDRIIVSNGRKNIRGYNFSCVYNGIKHIKIPLHRAVASTFIPVDLEKPDSCETVNHKNGNKNLNFITNLEWCTTLENAIHAIDTDLIHKPYKTIKATWVLDDENYGSEIYFRYIKLMEKYGLSSGSIYEALEYDYIAYGCKWEIVTRISAIVEIPLWYKNVLKDRNYLNSRTKPVLGTVVEGRLKGLQFVLFGINEYKILGATAQNIYKACTGIRKSPYLGIRWKYISRSESKQYQRGLSKEQISLLHS